MRSTSNEMRRIARELAGRRSPRSCSAPNRPEYDVEIRFFSPRREVGFVGHATVAAHYVRAMVPTGCRAARYARSRQAGIVEVEVSGTGAGPARFTIHQTPATFGPIVPEERLGPVLDALGISSVEPASGLPGAGPEQGQFALLIGLQSPDYARLAAAPMDQLIHLTPHVGRGRLLRVRHPPGGGPLTTESRMFCPVIGVPEDPVSGNAHGMLGVYLLQHGLLAPTGGEASFVGHQGASSTARARSRSQSPRAASARAACASPATP
jgi:PhzF family phenazine biosynthesis protein